MKRHVIGLTELAYACASPEVLECKFEATYGFNPVVLAVHEYHKRKKEVSIGVALLLLAVALALPASINFTWGIPATGLSRVGPDSPLFALMFVTSMSGLFAFLALVFGCLRFVHYSTMTERQSEGAKIYYEDLELMVRWFNLSSVAQLRLEEQKLRDFAKAILNRCAADVLSHRRSAEVANGAEEVRQRELEAGTFQKLQARLVVLNRRGIADMDLKPYFSGGEKILEAEELARQQGMSQPHADTMRADGSATSREGTG